MAITDAVAVDRHSAAIVTDSGYEVAIVTNSSRTKATVTDKGCAVAIVTEIVMLWLPLRVAVVLWLVLWLAVVQQDGVTSGHCIADIVAVGSRTTSRTHKCWLYNGLRLVKSLVIRYST